MEVFADLFTGFDGLLVLAVISGTLLAIIVLLGYAIAKSKKAK